MTGLYAYGDGIVLQTVPDALQPLVDGILSAIPSIIGAIVILIIGWIIGRLLGGVVKRVVRGLGISRYVAGTPLDSEGDVEGSLASSLGKIVKYIIYIFAILLALQRLNLPIPGGVLSNIATVVLHIVAAAIILIVGVFIGRTLGGIIGDVLAGFGLDSYLEGTPFTRITDSAGGIGSAIGSIVEYIIYYFALVQAVDALQFGVLTRMLNGVTNYLPILIGAFIVLLVGIFVADWLRDLVAGIDESRATDYVGLGVMVFVYYITATIVLNRLGLEVEILQNLFNAAVAAFFGALGLGLAIAIGIGVGWGSKDFVAANIDDWFGSAQDSASEMTDESSSGSDSDGFESPDSTDD